jgi:peptide/nickel transport system substrate-binding protein
LSKEKPVSRRKFLKYAGAGVVVVAAGAAGVYYYTQQPAPPTGTTSTSATSAATSAVQTGASVKTGGTLHVTTTSDAVVMDSHGTGGSASRIWNNIYESLCVGDVNGNGPNFWLASDIKNPSPLEWVLKLRQNVKWHCGATFDAQSAKESMDYDNDPNHLSADHTMWVPNLTEIVVEDPYTLRLKLTKPYAPALDLMSLSFMSLSHYADRVKYGADFGTKIACGTGPWMYNVLNSDYGAGSEWVKGKYAKLARNPNYNGFAYAENGGLTPMGPPPADFLELDIIPEDATQAASLQSGDMDVNPRAPITYLDQLKKDPNLAWMAKPQLRMIFLGFNSLKFPVNILEFRQACSYALDTDTICKTVLKDAGIPMTGLVPSNIAGYANLPHVYDPNKAKALLQQIGWPDKKEFQDIGAKIVLEYSIAKDPLNPEVSEAVKGFWDAVGIKTDLSGLEDAAHNANGYIKPPEKRPFHVSLGGVPTFGVDSSNRLFLYNNSWSSTDDQELRDTMDDAVAAPDPADQKRLTTKVQEIVIERAYTIPVYQVIWTYMWNKRVHNVKPLMNFYQQGPWADVWKE